MITYLTCLRNPVIQVFRLKGLQHIIIDSKVFNLVIELLTSLLPSVQQ